MRRRFGVTVTCCVASDDCNCAGGLWPAVQRINSCFEESIAALRLNQFDQLTELCDKIINDALARPEMRGQALAQRGHAHFRRWAVLEVAPDATRGIADITERLRLHTPAKDRKHQLLVIRAQLLAPPASFAARATTTGWCCPKIPATTRRALDCERSARPSATDRAARRTSITFVNRALTLVNAANSSSRCHAITVRASSTQSHRAVAEELSPCQTLSALSAAN